MYKILALGVYPIKYELILGTQPVFFLVFFYNMYFKTKKANKTLIIHLTLAQNQFILFTTN